MLLIDALDEALTYSGSTNIVHLLAKLSDLPPQVRILATTRLDDRVFKHIREAPQFDLIENAPGNVDDVKQYVLEQLPAQDGLEEDRRTLLATRLSQKADGSSSMPTWCWATCCLVCPRSQTWRPIPCPTG